MGGGTWDPSAYKTHTAQTQTKSQQQVFTQRAMNSLLDPHGVRMRESRDSVDNPNSTPILVGVDVTGSMGVLAESIAKKGLGTLFENILDRKPVTDPHIAFAAIGDHYSDSAPLQVSQFEADNRVVDQLEQIWLEGNGGGNGGESYLLPWYFAATHTSIDSLSKRNQKGWLFTIGDERVHQRLERDAVERIIGDKIEKDLTINEILTMVKRMYNVYHLCVGGYQGHGSLKQFRELLGENAIEVSDHDRIAEIIVSILQVAGGADAKTVAASWDGSTQVVVYDAIKNLKQLPGPKSKVVRL